MRGVSALNRWLAVLTHYFEEGLACLSGFRFKSTVEPRVQVIVLVKLVHVCFQYRMNLRDHSPIGVRRKESMAEIPLKNQANLFKQTEPLLSSTDIRREICR